MDIVLVIALSEMLPGLTAGIADYILGLKVLGYDFHDIRQIVDFLCTFLNYGE